MDNIAYYRSILQDTLLYYAQLTTSEQVQADVVFDQEHNRYALIYAGWNGNRRAYGNTFYATIRDGKLHIEHDGIGYGISDELIAKGIPEEDIILAWMEQTAEIAAT